MENIINKALKQRAVNPYARLKEKNLVRTDSFISRSERVRLLGTQARMCKRARAKNYQTKKIQKL